MAEQDPGLEDPYTLLHRGYKPEPGSIEAMLARQLFLSEIAPLLEPRLTRWQKFKKWLASLHG